VTPGELEETFQITHGEDSRLHLHGPVALGTLQHAVHLKRLLAPVYHALTGVPRVRQARVLDPRADPCTRTGPGSAVRALRSAVVKTERRELASRSAQLDMARGAPSNSRIMPSNPRIQLLPDGPFIEIDGGALYLGRDCHLASRVPALLSKVVSNRHCCMKANQEGNWTLEDLRSTNGTWLRGRRLTGGAPLHHGDIFSLGRAGPQFVWQVRKPGVSEAEATLLEQDAGDTTMPLGADGSDERPFRVGRTPEVSVRHARTGQVLSAKGYTIVLGRDSEAAQIVIRGEGERQVSSRHAQIQFRSDGTAFLCDLGSRNGTWLNEQRLGTETAIGTGDRIVLGAPATTLVVTLVESWL
jgi:pSer/pThr/pTyr-binding forkhead associated (FHA) protein